MMRTEWKKLVGGCDDRPTKVIATTNSRSTRARKVYNEGGGDNVQQRREA